MILLYRWVRFFPSSCILCGLKLTQSLALFVSRYMPLLRNETMLHGSEFCWQYRMQKKSTEQFTVYLSQIGLQQINSQFAIDKLECILDWRIFTIVLRKYGYSSLHEESEVCVVNPSDPFRIVRRNFVRLRDVGVIIRPSSDADQMSRTKYLPRINMKSLATHRLRTAMNLERLGRSFCLHGSAGNFGLATASIQASNYSWAEQNGHCPSSSFLKFIFIKSQT